MTTNGEESDESDHYDGKSYVIAAAVAFTVMLLLIVCVRCCKVNDDDTITDAAEIREKREKSKLYETVISILDFEENSTLNIMRTVTFTGDDCRKARAVCQLIVSVAFLVVMSVSFVNFFKDDDFVPDKTAEMSSLSKFFVSVQFLLMVKSIDRTVVTGIKLSKTEAEGNNTVNRQKVWKFTPVFSLLCKFYKF